MPRAVGEELFGGCRREVGGQTAAEPVDETTVDDDGEVEGVAEDVLPGIAELTVSPGRDGTVVRSDTNVEVVFFHSWPELIYAELVHSFCLKGVVDLTAGSGAAALACIKAKKPYLGCCLSDCHKEHLEQHILKKIFDEMLKEDSKMPCVELTKAIKDADAKPKPQKRAAPKKATGKKKAKKAKTGEGKKDEDDDDDEEVDEEQSDEGDA